MSSQKQNFIKPEISVDELTKALHEVTIKLNKSNQQLIASENNRRNLYANIAHDLRAPLSSIMGNVEYLLSFDKVDEEDLDESLKIINSKCNQLNNMIENLFTISMIDSIDSNNLDLHPINISDYMKNHYITLLHDTRLNSRTLKYEDNLEKTLLCQLDVNKFDRAIDNLLTNAIKFTETNDVICISLHQSDSSVIINISDTGIGISEANLKRVFDRAYKVSTARTPSNDSGLGLGLSIVKDIVHLHNGSISCSSTPKHKTTFSIRLPIN